MRAQVMTFRARLALWYSALLTVTIIILSLVVVTISRASQLGTLDQVLSQTSAGVLQNVLVIPVGDFGGLGAQVVFKSEEIFRAPGVSVQVWQTHDGEQPMEPTLVRASNFLTGETEPLDPTALGQTTTAYRNFSLEATPIRVLTVPFFSATGQQMGVVQVAASILTFEQANDALLGIIFIAAAISILVSLILGMALAQRALKPIQRVTQAAASVVEAKDLSTRITWNGPNDELGQLIQMFNQLMQRLEHLFSVQQRFVGDVSHEMRTPLTSILGHLEIIERYGFDKESFDAVQREAGRMSRMVNDLLLLARADNGELQVELYPLDLDTILLEVYEQALILAKGRALKIVLERIEPAHILGNSDRLKQLMLNLVNNAIKFTSDGGKIFVAVYVEEQHALFDVRDTGIGISEADVQRIFDRFFQADNSRAHRSDNDGAGLGLSIVRWIADTHQGKIDVFSQLGQGTLFRVRFPLLAQPAPSPLFDTGPLPALRSEKAPPDMTPQPASAQPKSPA